MLATFGIHSKKKLAPLVTDLQREVHDEQEAKAIRDELANLTNGNVEVFYDVEE